MTLEEALREIEVTWGAVANEFCCNAKEFAESQAECEAVKQAIRDAIREAVEDERERIIRIVRDNALMLPESVIAAIRREVPA